MLRGLCRKHTLKRIVHVRNIWKARMALYETRHSEMKAG